MNCAKGNKMPYMTSQILLCSSSSSLFSRPQAIICPLWRVAVAGCSVAVNSVTALKTIGMGQNSA
jgi:hypothetical protein